MRTFCDTLGGLWQLARLAVLSGFRFDGLYWKWRRQTAFGRGYPLRGEMIRSILEYARWMHRMRRM